MPASLDVELQSSKEKESSKGKGKALPRVKHEVDVDEATIPPKNDLRRVHASGQTSPSTHRQRQTNITVEVPFKKQPQSSTRAPTTNRQKSTKVLSVPTPVSITRPKIEEPDEDVIFVPKAGPAPGTTVREGVGEPPPVSEQQVGAVTRFLTHQCDPPIPQDRLQDMVDLFKKLGISTEYELKAIAKPGNVQDFWMRVARKEGLSTLWEAVIRDGLGKLV